MTLISKQEAIESLERMKIKYKDGITGDWELAIIRAIEIINSLPEKRKYEISREVLKQYVCDGEGEIEPYQWDYATTVNDLQNWLEDKIKSN